MLNYLIMFLVDLYVAVIMGMAGFCGKCESSVDRIKLVSTMTVLICKSFFSVAAIQLFAYLLNHNFNLATAVINGVIAVVLPIWWRRAFAKWYELAMREERYARIHHHHHHHAHHDHES